MKYVDVVMLSDFTCLVSVTSSFTQTDSQKDFYPDIVLLFYVPENSFLKWIHVVVFMHTFTKT